MKKILIFTTALLMGMSSWATVRNLNIDHGWGGASFNISTNTITYTAPPYGAYGDTGGWGGLGDLTGWKEVVVEFEPTNVPIKIEVQFNNGRATIESVVATPGSREVRLALSGDLTGVSFVMITHASETVFGSVTINRFYLTSEATIVTPDPGNGDLTFESDVIDNGYMAPVTWQHTGAWALVAANPAPDVVNNSSKVLKLDIPAGSEDGYSYVILFPNASLAPGKTWRDVEAVEFKALVPANGYNIHFGAGMPESGFAGISYGDGPNFWAQEGHPNHSDGTGWVEFRIGYNPDVNETTEAVLNSNAVDFYLGLNTADVTIYLDDITFVYRSAASVPATISGPEALSLEVGYAATSTDAYIIGGTEPVSVSITSNEAVGWITWNNGTKRLDIAAGIQPGTYEVVLTATNGTEPATATFTLTVNAVAPTISGPATLSLAEGYAATSTGAYTITGTAPVVSINSETGLITWSNTANRLEIAAGIQQGTYEVVLTATNDVGADATTFTLTVIAAAAPTISGLEALSLADGYAATFTGAYTITGTGTVTVSINSPTNLITWNSTANRLEIATGILPGTYDVVLTATNNVGYDATTFTLTVTAVAPAISGPAQLTLAVGYSATSTEAYTITGTQPVTVSIASQTEQITWNSAANRLEIATGLQPGTYGVELTATNDVGADATAFALIVTAAVAPTISGPAQMSLVAGYAATSTGAYAITGTGPVTVSITRSDANQITWNDAAKTLNIAAGIQPGVYEVVLTATNNVGADATTFTLTVTAVPPAITGPATLSLVAGYAATSTNVYTITGTAPVTVSITSSNPNITWNDAAKTLNIAAGIQPGTYPVLLVAANGFGADATATFTLTVTAVPPAISGPTALSLAAGYAATSTNAYTITGTAVNVSITSSNPNITWNNAAKTLDIAAGIQPGTYVVLLVASNGFGADATVIFTLTVSQTTGFNEIQQTSPLKAWGHNGQLYVTGLTTGETLSIYGINGAIIYQSVVTSNEVSISLPAQGVYIVNSGYNTIKVAF
jgi:hypothetical protein